MKHTIKPKIMILAFLVIVALLAGCGKVPTPSPTPTPSPILNSPEPTETGGPTESPGQDVKTTASIVNNAEAFEKAVGADGTWIICLLNDLTINKELVLEGEFTNGKKDDAGKDIIQRKIALYTQDENRNITNRFTLTVPKMTIKSPNASIQHGTFKGDLYVSVSNFQLVDATVEGNVYFTSDEAKSTFKMDDKSKVTGKQELKK